ncbi:MAG: YifB family Mg chelatase-like AAA ATPase [Lachnospiraceae bacterium]|nr:YifB family Mg chelatase-like AAA ATPase [Lachnospiraceae bacterium]
MFSTALSAVISGLESRIVQVEADVSTGLPYFDMVGYLSGEVKEARERVRTAVRNSGFSLEPKRIVINLSPADIRKSGTSYDLAIAAAILSSYGLLPQNALKDTLLVGELSLNGGVRGVRGVLPIILMARKQNVRRCLVPADNAFEGAQIGGIEVYGVHDLIEAVGFLRGTAEIRPVGGGFVPEKAEGSSSVPDFIDIRGQETLKRSMEIAAAGMHNILMIGPPGSGKSMAARRLPSIMPSLTYEERLEISEIYSVAGKLDPHEGLVSERPFRNPHHTIPETVLAGGGRTPEPGEISLAHLGVLFLDELNLFSSKTLEVMREPVESGRITVSRMAGSCEFPARFMLVGAMNPCRCGFYPDMAKCRCTPLQIKRYLEKVSQPLLDRIDMIVEVKKIPPEEIISDSPKGPESSADIRARVEKARLAQAERYKGSGYLYNSQLLDRDIDLFCRLGAKERRLAKRLYDKFNLSARTYRKILKVSRTIADLEGADEITEEHLCEAAYYKSLDRKYWGGIYGEY